MPYGKKDRQSDGQQLAENNVVDAAASGPFALESLFYLCHTFLNTPWHSTDRKDIKWLDPD
jgi:hypothetical protein